MRPVLFREKIFLPPPVVSIKSGFECVLVLCTTGHQFKCEISLKCLALTYRKSRRD